MNTETPAPIAPAQTVTLDETIWQLRRMVSLVESLFTNGEITGEEDPDAWERLVEADALLKRIDGDSHIEANA